MDWMKLSFLSGFNCIKSHESSLIKHLFGFEIIYPFDPAEVLPFVISFPETPINFTKFLFRGTKKWGKSIHLANNAVISKSLCELFLIYSRDSASWNAGTIQERFISQEIRKEEITSDSIALGWIQKTPK